MQMFAVLSVAALPEDISFCLEDVDENVNYLLKFADNCLSDSRCHITKDHHLIQTQAQGVRRIN